MPEDDNLPDATVIPFRVPKRRLANPQPSPNPVVTCECGSAWFIATVCLEHSPAGPRVTGHMVPFMCLECEEEYDV